MQSWELLQHMYIWKKDPLTYWYNIHKSKLQIMHNEIYPSKTLNEQLMKKN
jgi:hypothetical protein